MFDRIREELGKKGARKADYVSLINRAINETLPRTTLTVGTVVVVLFAILALGPVVIPELRPRPFSWHHRGNLLIDLRRVAGSGRDPEALGTG